MTASHRVLEYMAPMQCGDAQRAELVTRTRAGGKPCTDCDGWGWRLVNLNKHTCTLCSGTGTIYPKGQQ